MQPEQEIDETRINHEARQEPEQAIEALGEPGLLEADEEARHDRERSREQIVRDDQVLARRKGEQLHQAAVAARIMPLNSGVWPYAPLAASFASAGDASAASTAES